MVESLHLVLRFTKSALGMKTFRKVFYFLKMLKLSDIIQKSVQ